MSSNGLIGVDLTNTNSDITKAGGGGHELGNTYTDRLGNDWIFVQASAASTQYDVVAIRNDYTTTPMTAAVAKTPVQVAFAQVAFAADAYGWVMTNGRPTITVLVDAAVNVPLYTSGTSGALDDATTTQMIRGLILTDTMTATTSGPMAAVANFPHIVWGASLSAI